MVSKIFLVVVIAFCLCQCLAKPAEEKDNLKKLSEQVQDSFQTLVEEFKKTAKFSESEESKKVVENIKTNTNELAGKLTEIIDKAKTELKAHSGDFDNIVESFKTSVSDTVKKLQEAHPTEAAKVEEYQKQIQTTYNELLTKSKETIDTVAKNTSGFQDDFYKFTENVVKEFKTNVDKINTELQKSIKEHEKQHKHR